MSQASDYAAAFAAEMLNSKTRSDAITAMRPPDFVSAQVNASVTLDGRMAFRGEGVVDLRIAIAFGQWIGSTFG
jgi:hypothetical protein